MSCATMSGLFRPWTAPEAGTDQDATISTTSRQPTSQEDRPRRKWRDDDVPRSAFRACEPVFAAAQYELAVESALLLGMIPGGAHLEEYGRMLQLQEKASCRKQRPKKYRCPHCQVAFSNNGQLKGHIRIHTGERPFKCEEASCGKTFTRNEELTRHKRIHSGLRPYACGSCGKRFGRKDHLKKHARTHQPQYHRQTLLLPFLPPLPPPYPYLYAL